VPTAAQHSPIFFFSPPIFFFFLEGTEIRGTGGHGFKQNHGNMEEKKEHKIRQSFRFIDVK